MTDEERQAIAGKLRQRAALWQTAYDYGACPEPYSAGLMRILRDEVTDAIGIDRLSPPDRILERLAELADRPECENLSMKPADELLCSVCGEHVDIARMGDCEDYHARFCPTCGKRPAGHPPYLHLGEPNMEIAMISQPMAGKTDEEIVEDRERAATALKAMGYEVLNTYFTADWPGEEAMRERGAQVPLYYLAKSLEQMSICRAVYFVRGWEDARGCKIEHEAAVAYGLEVIHE